MRADVCTHDGSVQGGVQASRNDIRRRRTDKGASAKLRRLADELSQEVRAASLRRSGQW